MTTTTACTVCPAWCIVNDCTGDHFAFDGSDTWPSVLATAWPADGEPRMTPFPTWSETENVVPAVALHLQSDDGNTEDTFDLTPAEARELARLLIRAAETVEATSC